MAIYKLRYRFKSYLSINVSNQEMRDKLGKPLYPRGESVADIWKPLQASLINTFDETSQSKKPDIADWETNMVLSPNAYEALSTMLSPYGEFLPLKIEGETWHLYNTTSIYDDIDLNASSQQLMDGMVMAVVALQFDEEKLGPAPVFRSNFDGRMAVYCKEAFKLAVQAQDSEALLFRENLTSPM
ncbi:hypothetical protein [Simiduia agarivorans]|uniref:Uncharacterized protein n=1 Tax=Simiduia agarivorans (strain DSM 21679 / JCM 13881 / BCRC 17597 / SA1) TaxID=1117647 RepID=K4KHD4_SIMAS|nr:hypothetical protein [Simiduia agarivorans]AFU98421.2 hypothetical protein M5M_06130 [Simiduia agarivorans SA1 = DSM 21679]